MNMSIRRLSRVVVLIAISADVLSAQRQIDFREQTNVRAEYRFTQDFSFAVMAAAILTNDLNEVGFAYFDGCLGYKITPNIGVNANYRQLFRRNLYNNYDRRHVLYADLDYTKGLPGPWTFTGTIRLQGQFFNHLFSEGPRQPTWYARTRVGLRYKINYYWQPFVESEMFTPLFNPQKPLPDQLRASLGFSYTFNRHIRVEFYEQMQREINSKTGNIFLLTAINWGLRF
jgi:hypothetical protein